MEDIIYLAHRSNLQRRKHEVTRGQQALFLELVFLQAGLRRLRIRTV